MVTDILNDHIVSKYFASFKSSDTSSNSSNGISDDTLNLVIYQKIDKDQYCDQNKSLLIFK